MDSFGLLLFSLGLGHFKVDLLEEKRATVDSNRTLYSSLIDAEWMMKLFCLACVACPLYLFI